MFVIGGDVADRGVQTARCCTGRGPVELGDQIAGVSDLLQVGPLALDVTEEGLDPRLIGRGVRAPEVLGDVDPGQELTRRMGPHLRAVVADREEHRDLPIIDGLLDLLGLPGQQRPTQRPSWEALRMSGQRCENPAAERYVHSVLDPLLAALGPTPFHFELMVVDAPDVNAFALPGGFVVVNAGLLAEAETGEEVAAVLGHELSHVTLRHSTKRIAGGLGAAAALGLVLGVVDLGAPAYTLAHLSGLGYERAQEQEADAHGLELLVRAGISPLGMATFFERLQSSLRPPELLSTHPDPGGRAERARQAAQGFQPRVVLPAPEGVTCGAVPK